MSTERKRILGMLAEGKISIDECDGMLSALPQEPKAETEPPAKKKSFGGMGACLVVILIGGGLLIGLVVLALGMFIVRGERVQTNPPEIHETQGTEGPSDER